MIIKKMRSHLKFKFSDLVLCSSRRNIVPNEEFLNAFIKYNMLQSYTNKNALGYFI